MEEEVKSRFGGQDYICQENNQFNVMINKKRKFDQHTFRNVENRTDGESLFLLARFHFEVTKNIVKSFEYLNQALHAKNANAHFYVFYLLFTKQIDPIVYKEKATKAFNRAILWKQPDALFLNYIFQRAENNGFPNNLLLIVARDGHKWARSLVTSMFPNHGGNWTKDENKHDLLQETNEMTLLLKEEIDLRQSAHDEQLHSNDYDENATEYSF